MESTPKPQPPVLTLRKVLSETFRLVKSQHRTFLALAFLFLLPSTLAGFLYPIISQALSPAAEPIISPENHLTNTAIPAKIILLKAADLLFSLVLSSCAAASIIYTAFHGLLGEPVKLRAAVKSLAASFFPLVATVIVSKLILFAVIVAFSIVVMIIFTTSAILGYLPSPFAMVIPLTVVFAVAFVYTGVIWCLANAVVVAESGWGYSPLKRSRNLIKGKRRLALCLNLIFGVVCYLVSYCYWYSGYGTAGLAAVLGGDGRRFAAAEWIRVVLILTVKLLASSALITLANLYALVANTVLYFHCRDINYRAGGKFSGEYFALPVDDYDQKAASLV